VQKRSSHDASRPVLAALPGISPRERRRRALIYFLSAIAAFAAGIVAGGVIVPAGSVVAFVFLASRALSYRFPGLDSAWRKARLRRGLVVVVLAAARSARAQSPPVAPTLGGWIELGYAANFERPQDRVNFGANFDWRANDYRLNQAYLVFQKPLVSGPTPSVGYRIDFLAGHDAPFFVANGLFSNFTGFDPTSGVGTDGPRSYRDVNRIGIDLPQFYLDLHFPGFFTQAGLDLRIGKFYTLMGREVYPAADTDFYSRAYENVYATPFTHTGFLATLHATPSWDVIAGVVRGWDVFKDNNDSVSFHGAFVWNSSDKRSNWTTTWITGPEQPRNNRDYRTLVTSYWTRSVDKDSKWVFSAGGHYAYEANAAVDTDGKPAGAKWYGGTINVFSTLNPRLRLGTRIEWFRDQEGTRTALLGRPGFSASFYEATFGASYKPLDSLTFRPEARLDWSPDARPYNDQADRTQFTLAADLIWRF
jgi:hypothetical protein